MTGPASIRARAASTANTLGVPLGTTGSSLFVGGETINNVGSFRNYFPGALDDIRIYDRALTDAEVLTIFNLP